MIRPVDMTICQMVGTLAVLAIGIGWSGVGHAELSHESLWGDVQPDRPGSCSTTQSETTVGDVTAMLPGDEVTTHLNASADETPFSISQSERSDLTSDCLETASKNSDKSNNICFEQAGVPASVVPTLAAKAHALDQSDSLVDRARQIVGLDEIDSPTGRIASRMEPVGLTPPSQPDPDNSCTTEPDSCRGLPPLPPSLSVDATATAPHLTGDLSEIPDDVEPRDPTIPERLRVRFSRGYHSLPLKPPRV